MAYNNGYAGAARRVRGCMLEMSSEFDAAGEEGDILGGRGGAHCCNVVYSVLCKYLFVVEG